MYTQEQLKNLVEKALANIQFPAEAGKLFDPAKYILSAGGKRLRPVLTLMASNIFSDKIDHAILPAAGLEIFHNFTLVHDDIMDNAPLRRNRPTVHSKWDVNQAILTGDVMVFIAGECFLHLPPEMLHPVLSIYNKTAIDVCIGQQLDMDFEKMLTVTAGEYIRMIELKTAALIAGCLKIGAVLGGAAPKERDLLYDFGINAGIAFQIQDDLLDAYGDSSKSGKTTGGDIAANKKTFLYIKAMETASGATLKTLQALCQEKETNPAEKISRVMEIYDSLNIKSHTEELANQYLSKAMSLLDGLNSPPERKTEIASMVLSLTGRSN